MTDITATKLTSKHVKCQTCKSSTNIYEISSTWMPELILCEDCRKSLLAALIPTVKNASDFIEEPIGGKWFQIWKEDKENIIATMYKNLSSDLEAGYEYSGRSIQNQLEQIDAYRAEYYSQLDKFVTMTDGQVSRWCYFDLKKRGAIE